MYGGIRIGRKCGIAAAATAALAAAAAPAPAAFDRPLFIPEVLTGSDLRIPMKQALVPVLDGPATPMWTYGGTFPGPTIRRPAGAQTRVTFVNELPAGTGEKSVHLHGGHNAASEDGQAHSELIAPGAQRTYSYDLQEAGAPERGAFQWYHDHRMDETARNVWNGLAGMFIVDDPAEAALDLPAGDRDVPLMVVDRSFGAGNELTYPLGAATTPFNGGAPFDDVAGNRFLVNGVEQPHLKVSDTLYRLRILNASNFRPYTFRLSDGSAFVQVGTESGLLPAPVTRTAITLGPAERAEVIVSFRGKLGERVRLISSVREDAALAKTDSPAAELMEFRVDSDEVDGASIPETLRPVDQALLSPPPVSRVFTFGLGLDQRKGGLGWAINGRTFDPERADAFPALGSQETWLLANTTPLAISHWIHIHGIDFKVVSRNGEPPPPWEAGLKETFELDPGEWIVITGRFTDHAGLFMFHCHMLEHEDHGMMSHFEAKPAPAGLRQAPRLSKRDVAAQARRAIEQARAAAVEARRAAPSVFGQARAGAELRRNGGRHGHLVRVADELICRLTGRRAAQ